MSFERVAAIGMLAVAAVTTSAWSAEDASIQVRITPNFTNVDIRVLADAVSQVTDWVIVVHPDVKAKFNLASEKPLTPTELYRSFVAKVNEQGLRVVEEQRKTTILPKVPDVRIDP
jgi:type II secretory pathway component GspD/PulD (secretin)